MHQDCYWGNGLLMWQKLLHMKRWYMEWKVSQMNLKVFVIYSPATSEGMFWNMIEDSGERLKGEWKLLFQKVIIITTYLSAFLLLYFSCFSSFLGDKGGLQLYMKNKWKSRKFFSTCVLFAKRQPKNPMKKEQ